MSLRVGLFAPIERQGGSSGVGRYAVSLTSALADLQAEGALPTLEFVVVTSRGNSRWVDETIREEMTVTSKSRPTDTFFADLDLDVVHYIVPTYAQTDRATLFNPYDLRHVFCPEFYRDQLIERRAETIAEGCREATVVDTPSQATAQNVIDEYGVEPDRVQALPLGPSITPAPDTSVAATRERHDIPDSFVLYPATLWPHKNHERLVDALEYVAETYGERIPLVCTGSRETPWVASEYEIENLDTIEGVTDLGYIEAKHLRALYRECRMLVYPSLFEGGGLPVIEGWAFDTPVVCADIPPLRETGGDAVSYVDPTDSTDIGEAIHEVWTDDSLRADLVERGRDRREQFTWRRTARMYGTLYRKAAGRDLSERERALLQYPDEA
jgi:glycosyltransferase involved in cell wall biosynthesis